MRGSILAAVSLLAGAVQAVHAQDSLPQQAAAILKKNCIACHGGGVTLSNLDLRTRDAMIAGGTRGSAIQPTEPTRSLLFLAVSHKTKPSMPPGAKLSDEEIETLRRWILAGAVVEESADDEDQKAALAKLEERPITLEERNFWSFRRLVRTQPPSDAANPIDAFLLPAMKAKGLRPSPRADARTLIRRAYLDLTGLPPTPEDVSNFVRDPSQPRWEALIDRLLGSAHYGERWGRHWLDLVRYADSGGFERDFDWPNAWRYRDYVVNAFNSDKPYNQFIREQIAGDEIAAESHEAMTATGYLRLGMDNNAKDERTRLDELDDLVSTTSLAFTGLTVGCARCHNHKFDPIAQKDYYQIQAVFASTEGTEYPLADAATVAAHETAVARIKGEQERLRKDKAALEEPYRTRLFEARVSALPEYLQLAWRTAPDKRTEGQRLNARQIQDTLRIPPDEIYATMPEDGRKQALSLDERGKALEREMPEKLPTARAIREHGREPLPSYFLHRGAPGARGSLMGPGIITVAWNGEYVFPSPPANASSTWRRRGFADWLASPENPLTPRVMVNRIWQHHFGEGIVRTPSNFGKTGQPPSHPELLDWLASEFMQRGWSIKAMHRLIMSSQTYQMASLDQQENLAIDPENRWLWRMPRQRLQAEVLRDQILAATGALDRTVGGPAIFPYIDPDLFQSSTNRQWPGKPDSDPSTWRRSIYVFSKRSIRYPFFEAFDQPDSVTSCDRRNRSTIAPQALLLMNNAFVILQAERFAERLKQDAGEDTQGQVERAYQLALGRGPTETEKARAVHYLRSGDGTLAEFAQMMFNLNEFAYRQ